MGTTDDLLQARQTFDRGDWTAAFAAWSTVDIDSLDIDDLDHLATVAYLIGHRDECVAVLRRAFARCEATGDVTHAIMTAFQLAMVFMTSGDNAVGDGWAARAERLLDELSEEGREHGYVRFLEMYRHLGTGELDAATACAEYVVSCGRRFGDPDLSTAGISSLGRLEIYAGRVAHGLRLFDEAMARVIAGEASAIIAGQAYCVMIEGCQEVSDLGRADEWTAAMSQWCEDQPGLVAFTGQCAVHRGQIMALHGKYRQAVEEFDRAVRRYAEVGTPVAAGQAYGERGDVLRLLGDLPGAEESYAVAADRGYEPQPGLALLWASQGRTAAATAAVGRLLAERVDPVARCRLLPGAIEILEPTASAAELTTLVDELDTIATSFGGTALLATAAHARGRLQLAASDPGGSLPYLRKAAALWSTLDAPYEGARVSVATAQAMRALGDSESAAESLKSARATADRLGVVPLLTQIERLMAPTASPRGLTEREVEVLRLVAHGRSNADIAQSLVLSERTVARHLSNIFTKLGVASRTAAAAFAFEHHLA